jgi:hypothetical protein
MSRHVKMLRQSRLISRYLDTSRCQFLSGRDWLLEVINIETLNQDYVHFGDLSALQISRCLFLYCQEFLDKSRYQFWKLPRLTSKRLSIKTFSTVELWVFKLTRLTLKSCQDQDSWSRLGQKLKLKSLENLKMLVLDCPEFLDRLICKFLSCQEFLGTLRCKFLSCQDWL